MNHHAQRGSILIYALLTMSTMLAISLTLSGLFISKLKLSAAARDSVSAIYIADSGVERCLYEARRKRSADPMELVDEHAKLSIVVASTGLEVVGTCNGGLGTSGDTFSFQAIGTYRGVQRSLEISQ